MFLLAGTGRLASRYVGDKETPMKAILVLGMAATVLGGCVVRETRVVYTPAPAPRVVYQSPPAVAYPQQQLVTYSPPSNHGIAVTYKGANGIQLAWQKADNYCRSQYGNSRVRLVSDDRAAGHAVFACDQL